MATCASDGEGLLGLLRGRPARMERHASRLTQEDVALQEEALRHGDMVFVDVVDTYRNVPSKLLRFYKWYVRLQIVSVSFAQIGPLLPSEEIRAVKNESVSSPLKCRAAGMEAAMARSVGGVRP